MHRIAKPLLTFLSFVALLILTAERAAACTCDLPPFGKTVAQQVNEARKNAEAVFSGRVLKLVDDPNLSYVEATFQVEGAWKWDGAGEVVVRTGRGGSCGFPFTAGESYLVYAYKNGGEILWTNICQRTAKLSAAADDLKVLGESGRPAAEGPPVNISYEREGWSGAPKPDRLGATGGETASSEEQMGERVVWLRLQNNSPRAVSFPTESLYAGPKVSPIRLRDGSDALALRPGVEVNARYKVEALIHESGHAAGRGGNKRVLLAQTAKPYRDDVFSTSWLPPGGHVIFRVPREHFAGRRAISVPFAYDDERAGRGSAKRREHHAYFSADSLPPADAGARSAARKTDGVCVDSWREGDERVVERGFRLNLKPGRRERVADVRTASGRRSYKLLFRYDPVPGIKLDHWKVELREVLAGAAGRGGTLGPNLLTAEGPGPGGDNFPRADLVGYLYPKTDPHVFKGDRLAFYPINAKRVVKVEDFFLVLQVESYRFNARRPNALDSLVLDVRLTNSYEESSCASKVGDRKGSQASQR